MRSKPDGGDATRGSVRSTRVQQRRGRRAPKTQVGKENRSLSDRLIDASSHLRRLLSREMPQEFASCLQIADDERVVDQR